MKIALVGNMNNTFSSLARYFLDIGFDVKLYRFSNEPEHFSVQADSFDPRLINQVEILPFVSTSNVFSKAVKCKFKEIRSNCDYVFACGYAPAWFHKANCKIDFLLPYGSDIYDLPFFRFSLNPKFFFSNWVFSKFQQAGIKNAELLIMEKQSVETEVKVQRLRGLAGRRSYNAIPMLHLPTYENLDTGLGEITSEFHDSVRRLRAKFDFLLFHHSRHSWLNPPAGIEQKGNNLLFEGLRDFLLANPLVSAAVVTLDYGVDVQNSKNLIFKLGLQDNVFWFPKQKRIDLMMGISVCDVVVAELTGGYNLYGTVMEALCKGKPIIQSRERDKYENIYKDGLHNALSVENYNSVGDLLTDYWANRSFYNESAKKGSKWYNDNIVSPFMNEISRIIESKRE
ncbi:hypothetical protein [Daejeonella sp. JGW-45]|uniref:hypothetical protein n=1 Tax=Daejeonella sp. JGW-45 TaxID=3034148 RepID=UPI0023EAD28D|nr:hypothetical protein [Daejeonella sp. JGW-45]